MNTAADGAARTRPPGEAAREGGGRGRGREVRVLAAAGIVAAPAALGPRRHLGRRGLARRRRGRCPKGPGCDADPRHSEMCASLVAFVFAAPRLPQPRSWPPRSRSWPQRRKEVAAMMALALVQTAMAEVVAMNVEVLAKVVALRYLPWGPRRP